MMTPRHLNKGKVLESFMEAPTRETNIKVKCKNVAPFVFFDSSDSRAKSNDAIIFELEYLPSVSKAPVKTPELKIEKIEHAGRLDCRIIKAIGKVCSIERRANAKEADILVVDACGLFINANYTGKDSLEKGNFVECGIVDFGAVRKIVKGR